MIMILEVKIEITVTVALVEGDSSYYFLFQIKYIMKKIKKGENGNSIRG
jgi:hypothetical protein